MMENGLSLSDIAAVTKNDDGGAFGGNWLWFIVLVLFVSGGRGFGGFGGGMPCGTPATTEDVTSAVNQQTLISKLDQQTYGLADSTYALNNAITNGFHGVQNGINGISHQISDCCCAAQRAIDNVRFENATNTCAIQNTIQNTTRDIIENNNNNARAVLDFLTQDKIATLTAENQSLKLAASQSIQNEYLISQLRAPVPIPAYSVPNPNCCYSGCAA